MSKQQKLLIFAGGVIGLTSSLITGRTLASLLAPLYLEIAIGAVAQVIVAYIGGIIAATYCEKAWVHPLQSFGLLVVGLGVGQFVASPMVGVIAALSGLWSAGVGVGFLVGVSKGRQIGRDETGQASEWNEPSDASE